MRRGRHIIELEKGESSPHMKANLDWVAELIKIMNMKAGGPVLGDKGNIRNDWRYARKG